MTRGSWWVQVCCRSPFLLRGYVLLEGDELEDDDSFADALDCSFLGDEFVEIMCCFRTIKMHKAS